MKEARKCFEGRNEGTGRRKTGQNILKEGSNVSQTGRKEGRKEKKNYSFVLKSLNDFLSHFESEAFPRCFCIKP